MTTIATLSPLSSPEQRKLAYYEETIERCSRAFVEVGLAMIAIRDGQLYRAEHESFEAYCKKRWGYGKSHAYRLMDSAKVVESCRQIGDVDPPTHEAQARVLAAIDTPQKQADVWVKAVETARDAGNPRVTAAHVRKAAQQVLHAKAVPEPEEDTDDPTDISEEPTTIARSDVHGLTPQAVDEAMARLQKQEREKAAPNVPDKAPPKPAEPNELGELREGVTAWLNGLVAGKPPHVRVFLVDVLKEWMAA